MKKVKVKITGEILGRFSKTVEMPLEEYYRLSDDLCGDSSVKYRQATAQLERLIDDKDISLGEMQFESFEQER